MKSPDVQEILNIESETFSFHSYFGFFLCLFCFVGFFLIVDTFFAFFFGFPLVLFGVFFYIFY